MIKTLVLNTDGKPVRVIPWYRTISFVYVREKAIVLEYYDGDGVKDGKGVYYRIPAVIVLKKYVKRPARPMLFYSKRVVKIRDNNTCQYCGDIFNHASLTVDHVIPKSRGGSSKYVNLVAACQACNRRKDNKTPEEAGMQLLSVPYEPTQAMISRANAPEEWKKYLL